MLHQGSCSDVAAYLWCPIFTPSKFPFESYSVFAAVVVDLCIDLTSTTELQILTPHDTELIKQKIVNLTILADKEFSQSKDDRQ